MECQQKGFTLLEVLLAGFILFSVLAATMMSYKGTIVSSRQAEKSLSMSAVIPSIRQLVTEAFHEDPSPESRQGKGTLGNLSYEWKATLTYRGKRYAFSDKKEAQYRLWHVDLMVKKGNLLRSYNFREVSW